MVSVHVCWFQGLSFASCHDVCLLISSASASSLPWIYSILKSYFCTTHGNLTSATWVMQASEDSISGFDPISYGLTYKNILPYKLLHLSTHYQYWHILSVLKSLLLMHILQVSYLEAKVYINQFLRHYLWYIFSGIKIPKTYIFTNFIFNLLKFYIMKPCPLQ